MVHLWFGQLQVRRTHQRLLLFDTYLICSSSTSWGNPGTAALRVTLFELSSALALHHSLGI